MCLFRRKVAGFLQTTRTRQLLPRIANVLRTASRLQSRYRFYRAVTEALEEKTKLDDLKGLLDEMLMETGGPLTPAERGEAERMVGIRPRRKRTRAA